MGSKDDVRDIVLGNLISVATQNWPDDEYLVFRKAQSFDEMTSILTDYTLTELYKKSEKSLEEDL